MATGENKLWGLLLCCLGDTTGLHSPGNCEAVVLWTDGLAEFLKSVLLGRLNVTVFVVHPPARRQFRIRISTDRFIGVASDDRQAGRTLKSTSFRISDQVLNRLGMMDLQGLGERLLCKGWGL